MALSSTALLYTETLFAIGGAWFVMFAVAIERRRNRAMCVRSEPARWRTSGTSVSESILDDRSGRARYVRINKFLNDWRVLIFIPGFVALFSWLFVWFLISRLATLFFVLFAGLVELIVFTRPQDALEGYLIAGRYRYGDSGKANHSDWMLLAQAYDALGTARWYYVLFGVALMGAGIVDLAFGAQMSNWLSGNVGRIGVLLQPSYWRFAALGATLIFIALAGALTWPKQLLESDSSFDMARVKSLRSKELRKTHALLFEG